MSISSYIMPPLWLSQVWQESLAQLLFCFWKKKKEKIKKGSYSLVERVLVFTLTISLRTYREKDVTMLYFMNTVQSIVFYKHGSIKHNILSSCDLDVNVEKQSLCVIGEQNYYLWCEEKMPSWKCVISLESFLAFTLFLFSFSFFFSF